MKAFHSLLEIRKAASLLVAVLILAVGLSAGVMLASATSDTIPPTDPTDLSSPSHTVGEWSTDPTVTVRWVGGTDDFSGVAGHFFGLSQDGTSSASGDVTATIDFTRPTIAAGTYDAVQSGFTVAIEASGTVVGVGANDSSQTDFASFSDIMAVAAGAVHTVGLKDDGTVMAAGGNGVGQRNVSAWTGIQMVAAGDWHSVGLKADGTVVAAGDNSGGQKDVSGWADITAVAAGRRHTVGLNSVGTVVAVGDNSNGETSVTPWTDIIAVAAGQNHTVGLKANGTVVAVGRNFSGETSVTAWADIVAVAAGGRNTIGLRANGRVVAVGDNSDNQITGINTWTEIVAIAAGNDELVGLKSDGTMVASGLKDIAQTNVAHWTGIKQPTYIGVVGVPADGQWWFNLESRDWAANQTTPVHLGPFMVDRFIPDDPVGLISRSHSDGVWSKKKTIDMEWIGSSDSGSGIAGYSFSWSNGDIALPDKTIDDVRVDLNRPSIAAGDWHSLGLKTDGTVIATGMNDDGQTTGTAGWTNIVALSGGNIHSVGLKSNGTVVAVGSNDWGQTNVSSWSNIKAIAASINHTVGLRENGTVVAVGNSSSGELAVSGWTDIVSIGAGFGLSLGVRADGAVEAVGRNRSLVSSWQDIIAVDSGDDHVVGLKADGTVVAGGNNTYGQTDVSGWENIVAVATGWNHTVGLKADGTVVAVGRNNHGQTDVARWKDLTAIATGADHTIGLRSTRRMTATGRGFSGQTNVWIWNPMRQPIYPSSYETPTDGRWYYNLRTRDGSGKWTSTVHDGPFLVDTQRPIVKMVTPFISTRISKTTTFKVKWTVEDAEPSSGLESVRVYYRPSGSAKWRLWKTPNKSGEAFFTGRAGTTYYFKTLAVDKARNWKWSKVYKTIVPFNEGIIESKIGFFGYSKSGASQNYLTSVRYSYRRGHTLKYKLYNNNSIGLVVTKGPNMGRAKIYVDGKYVRTVDAHSSKVRPRQLIFYKGFTKKGTHWLKVVNLGTPGRARFEVDGVVVGR